MHFDCRCGRGEAEGRRTTYHHNADGEHRLGGIGENVTAEVAGRTGKESRCCVLGHLQRGGSDDTRQTFGHAIRPQGGSADGRGQVWQHGELPE